MNVSLTNLLEFLQAYGYPILWLYAFVAAFGVPLPVTLLTCWSKPARSKVPLTVSAVVVGKASATPLASVAPVLTVVLPV